MSESMIDRVAKAIYDAANAEDYVSDYRFHDGDTTLDGRFNLDKFARAAIEAMREPTKAMLKDGWEHTADPCWEDDVADCWRAMIDAALSEKP